MSVTEITTVTLFGAKDSEGRLYLTDSRDRLPPDMVEINEFLIAPEKVEWAILQMHVEEIRLIPVIIRIGDYDYASPPSSDISGWLTTRKKETA